MAGGAVVGEQSDEDVLVRPDIPDRTVPSGAVSLAEPVALLVRAQIAVGELGVDQAADGRVHARLQAVVPGEQPRVGCRVQKLADVLPGPPLLARPVDERLEDHVQIEREQALLDVDCHAVGNPSVVPATRQIGWLEGDLDL